MAGLLARLSSLVPAVRANWLAALLLAAGLALRVLTIVSYRPALFYIDTVRYLYDSGGNDPVGYRLPLKAILIAGNFDVLAVVQHLLGLAMAAAIYLVLVRLGAWRWLAAAAMAPVLLDAYQLQMEQLVLPDVWFEALIVAGITVLLAGRAPVPRLRTVAAAGLILGVSVTFRQVGEILILPVLLYLAIAIRGWRPALTRCAVLTAAFAVPILGYLTGSGILVGHFYLSHTGVTTTYGRMAWSADCATLRLPAVERGLCPTPAQRAHGPDWLEHGSRSPIRVYYTGPLSARASRLVASFNDAVLSQQPERVLGTYARDAVKLFALSKVTSPGDTPVMRWQFQVSYPYLSPHATPAQVLPAIAAYGGGRPAVWRPGARFLRRYQLGGGYTPGPLLGFCVLAGLAVSLLAAATRLRRRILPAPATSRGSASRSPAATATSPPDEPPNWWLLAGGCVLFSGCGVALLAISDLFEFTWRYQLPALITLPPAGALAIAALAARRYPSALQPTATS